MLSLFGCRFLKVEICLATVTYFLQDSASLTAVVEVAVAAFLKSLISCKFFTYLRPNHIVNQPAIPPVSRHPNQATQLQTCGRLNLEQYGPLPSDAVVDTQTLTTLCFSKSTDSFFLVGASAARKSTVSVRPALVIGKCGFELKLSFPVLQPRLIPSVTENEFV